MHYFITGGAGFIGSNLIAELLRREPDAFITCIDNFDPFYSPAIKDFNIREFKSLSNFRFLSIDLARTPVARLTELVPESIDVIVHLAGKAGVRPSIQNPEAYQEANIIGLQHTLDFARQKNCNQFVFASSSSVYGVNDHFPWKEDEQLLPISPYAMTKLAGEMMGHVYHRLYGMRFIALRFFTVYGPGQRPDLAIHKFTRSILADIDYEVILVDDGSTDKTIPEILANADDRIKLVELRKNYGQSTAMTAGIDFSTGRYVALLDGDLQNDPTDIPAMLELLKKEDWDVVAGNRKNRKDGFILRKIPSRIANALIRRMTGVYIKDYGCTLKVFKREIAEELGLYGELHRFIPVLAKLQGARITQVDVKHHARQFGKSKYGINRTFKVMADLILMVFFRKYLQKPMHLFGTIGFVSFGLGLLINLYLLVIKLMGHNIWNRPLLILGMILLLGGIQLITIGIIADINVRTYFESQNKKTYTVRRLYHNKEEIPVVKA